MTVFALCLSLIPNIYNSQAATYSGKKNCTHLFKNANIVSHQTLCLYSRDGKAHCINTYSSTWDYNGKDGQAKYWVNTKKNSSIARLMVKTTVKDQILSAPTYYCDVEEYAPEYFMTKITKNYTINGKNYKGYYAVPFRIYGYLEMRCSKCGETVYTKPKMMYSGYYMIKYNSKGNPVLSAKNFVFLSTNNLARTDATIDLPDYYLANLFHKQNWVPLKRYYKNGDWRQKNME